MDIEDLIICLVGYMVWTSGWIRFPHDFRAISSDFRTVSARFPGFRTVSNDFHNSDRLASSVTPFCSHFAHLSGILEVNSSPSVVPGLQKWWFRARGASN